MGNKRRIVLTEEEFYYIPVIKTLQAQLLSKNIINMILDGPQLSQVANTFEDFPDGSFVQEHELFSCDDSALRLLFYYDDVNINNPLTNKLHKLSFFYYQLANIKPIYRSKLKSVHLLAICKTSYMKKYGINAIFSPIVEDLKILANGHPFQIYGGVLRLRGSLLALLADTPASQLCGGFKEGVGGAFRKCRVCHATFERMQELFIEEDFNLRTKEDHALHVELVENAPTNFLKEFYSKKCGVTFRSKLMEAPFFDVTQQLPMDIMHVFLEGVLAYEIKYLLRHCIDERYFSLATLNKDIEKFPLGYAHKKDRPIVIKDTDLQRESATNLGQTASKMWLLASILPMILAKYLDKNSTPWQCLSSLLEIMGMAFSEKISTESVMYLKTAIKEHLSLFKNEYGARLIPKQHYLVHLPSQVLKFGPLIRTWCMRHEGKHSFFKDLASNIKNFKNLPYSLAMKHQKVECANSIVFDEYTDTSPLFGREEHNGKVKVLVGAEATLVKDSIERFYNVEWSDENHLFQTNAVTITGTLYKPGKNTLLHFSNNEEGLPEFGRLIKIWQVLDLGTFFVMQPMETVAFDLDMNAVIIEESSLPQGNQISRHEDLPSYHVHHAYTLSGKLHVPLKQYICDSK